MAMAIKYKQAFKIDIVYLQKIWWLNFLYNWYSVYVTMLTS